MRDSYLYQRFQKIGIVLTYFDLFLPKGADDTLPQSWFGMIYFLHSIQTLFHIM